MFEKGLKFSVTDKCILTLISLYIESGMSKINNEEQTWKWFTKIEKTASTLSWRFSPIVN